MKAGEHGPDKVYNKFTVVKSKHVGVDKFDHSSDEEIKWFPADKELTNKDEWIFVLRPETNDQAAIAALWAYAAVCRTTYPQLADEIEAKLRETIEKYPEGNPNLR